MKRTITTAVAVLFATAISATAMTSGGGVTRGEIAAMGYSSEAVQALTVGQLKQLSIALHNGEDSDIRTDVRSMMNKFSG